MSDQPNPNLPATTRTRGPRLPASAVQQQSAIVPHNPNAPTALKQGDDVYAAFDAEQQKNAEKQERRAAGLDNVYPFWLEKGKEAGIIILDASLGAGCAIREHNLKGADGRFGNLEVCPTEFENCPLCAAYGESSLVLKLTVLDLRGYDRKNDKGEVIEHVKAGRKSLTIPVTAFPKFREIEGFVLQAHGTLRGTYLYMRRGMGEKSPRIGEPALLDGGVAFDWFDEQWLIEEYGHPEIRGEKDGKLLKAANAELFPYDYKQLYTLPTAADLRKRWRIAAPPGSVEAANEAWGSPAQTPGAPAQGGGTRTRQPAAPAAATQENPPAPASVPQPTGTRTRTPAAAAAPVNPQQAAQGDPFVGH